MDKVKRIKELVSILNVARDEYYNHSVSIMTDFEYDKLFDELKELEDITDIVMTNSPVRTVGYEVKSKLEKVRHNHPMLSLDKTKSVDELVKFKNEKPSVMMLKMDGLTVSLRYLNGELVSAESRGNGEIGENILHTAKTFSNIPLKIEYKNELIVDGEAIIDYKTFEKINSKLPEDDKYRNPRNLASGSVRQLDSKISKSRNVKFIAWKCVKGFKGNDFSDKLINLVELGFDVVPFEQVSSKDNVEMLKYYISSLKEDADALGYPIDGMVLGYSDIAYGESLGMTGHHLRSQIAYKFYDEEIETTLNNIDWTMGKTGILTPTAVFNPVEIEGTIVERASLHNISIMKELELSYGDTITVYKANQIIPQIRDNLDRSNDNICLPPSECPVCGKITKIVKENDSEILVCTNPDCKGKLLGKLVHAASKNALNIDGLSEATLEKFVNLGWLSSIKDIYYLKNYSKDIQKLEGFGEKSTVKLLDAIEKSRNTDLSRFIYAQSIPLIGKTASKDIAKVCNYNIDQFRMIIDLEAEYAFMNIDGFGKEMNRSLRNWWNKHRFEFCELAKEFTFENPLENKEEITEKRLEGKTFVVTGKLEHFSNRDELVSKITDLGGKVSGSVSAKTDFLINNDTESSSSKNIKAKSLGIPIISEQDFLNMLN